MALGTILLEKGNYTEALKAFSCAADLIPDRLAYLGRAECLKLVTKSSVKLSTFAYGVLQYLMCCCDRWEN